MRLMIVNPNSTVTMTVGIVAAARAAAAPDVTVEGRTNTGAPPAIQGPKDGAAAVPGMLEIIAGAQGEGFDAAIIACFDDPGLAEARAATTIPVIGIGQAAFLAAMVHGRFSVITTLPVSIPVVEENIRAYGMAEVCGKVHASGLPVLSLEQDPETARGTLATCAKTAARQDDVQALVLGCAGMAPFARAMQGASGLPAVDGVAAAVGLARTVIKATG